MLSTSVYAPVSSSSWLACQKTRGRQLLVVSSLMTGFMEFEQLRHKVSQGVVPVVAGHLVAHKTQQRKQRVMVCQLAISMMKRVCTLATNCDSAQQC